MRDGWERQVQKQRENDEHAIRTAQGEELATEEGSLEFDDFLEHAMAAREVTELTTRQQAGYARHWLKRAGAQAEARKSPHAKAVLKAELEALAQKVEMLGPEWLEVYSDASVQLGQNASDDACGVGVWVAHKSDEQGAQSEVTAAAECVAIHLERLGGIGKGR